MYKIIILFCFVAGIQNVFAQNNNPDNVKAALARYSLMVRSIRTSCIKECGTNNLHVISVEIKKENKKIRLALAKKIIEKLEKIKT